MRVAVYGGRHFNNVAAIYEALYQLVDDLDDLLLTDEPGAGTLLVQCANALRVPYRIITAQWLLHGQEAEMRRRRELINCKPDMVMLLPGDYDDSVAMTQLCSAADIPIWDLTALPFALLSGRHQLGGTEPEPSETPF